MALTKYDNEFETFLTNIVLTESQADRIDGALASLSGLFLTVFNGDVEIYVQGSFATNTTVKPLTQNQSQYGPGAFDVDIVLERSSWDGAADSLKQVEDILAEYPKYSERLGDEKESCIRLEYAPDSSTGVGFHVDIVPIKNKNGRKNVARRTADKWEESDSKQLIEWVLEQQSANPYLTATVLALKRMRDMVGLTEQLTSIILFSLLKGSYIEHESYADELLNTLLKIEEKLDVPLNQLQITNPINDSEDIISKWRADPSILDDVKEFITNASHDLGAAFTEGDFSKLQLILSDDFPVEALPANVQSMRSEHITIAGTPELRRGDISASSNAGTNSYSNLWVFFERDKSITFKANGIGRSDYILWQVCNSPGSESLRGKYFAARAKGGSEGTSHDPTVNYENEKYTGRHWIRFIAYNKHRQLSTIGSRFYVDVKGSGTSRYHG